MSKSDGPKRTVGQPPRTEAPEAFVDHFFQLVMVHEKNRMAWHAAEHARLQNRVDAERSKEIAAERAALLRKGQDGKALPIDRRSEGDADR